MSVAFLATLSFLLGGVGIAGIVIAATQPDWFSDTAEIGSWSGWRVITMFAGILALVIGLTLGTVAYLQANYKAQLNGFREVELDVQETDTLQSIFETLGNLFSTAQNKGQRTKFVIYYKPLKRVF